MVSALSSSNAESKKSTSDVAKKEAPWMHPVKLLSMHPLHVVVDSESHDDVVVMALQSVGKVTKKVVRRAQ